MYVTIRSQLTSIMDVIRPKLSKLCALELENIAILDFIYTLASVNINQLAPNLVTIYITIRSQISYITVITGLEHPELFALELGKIAEFDFVYTLASTSINQSVPNLVRLYVTIKSRMARLYVTIKSRMISVIDVIKLELSKLSALELENSSICKYKSISTKLVTVCMTIRSRMSWIMDVIGPAHPKLFAI